MVMLSPVPLPDAPPNTAWGWSVAYRSMLPTLREVHDYGCRVAEKSNETKAKKYTNQKRVFDRSKHSVFYVGSYDVPIEGVSEVTSPYFSISVEPFETKGLREHCRIRIDVRDPDAQTDDDLIGDRTEIIWQLWDLHQSFQPHICECDKPEFEGILLEVQKKLTTGPFEAKDGTTLPV